MARQGCDDESMKSLRFWFLYLLGGLIVCLRATSFHHDDYRMQFRVNFPSIDTCINIPNGSIGYVVGCGDYEGAIEHYSKLRSPRPTDAYFVGLALAHLGKWQQAVTILSKTNVPSNAFLQSRQVLYESGQIEELLLHTQIALMIEPVIGVSSYPYNDLLTAANDYQNWGFVDIAAQLLTLLSKQWDKKNWEHWHYAVRATSLNGTNAQVLQVLTQARQYFPKDQFFLNRQIGLLYQLDEFDEVLDLADEWQIYQPNSAMPNYFRGLAWMRKGAYALSESEFWQAWYKTNETDQRVRILIGLGKLSQMQGDLEHAKVYFQQALELDPTNLEARSNLDGIK